MKNLTALFLSLVALNAYAQTPESKTDYTPNVVGLAYQLISALSPASSAAICLQDALKGESNPLCLGFSTKYLEYSYVNCTQSYVLMATFSCEIQPTLTGTISLSINGPAAQALYATISQFDPKETTDWDWKRVSLGHMLFELHPEKFINGKGARLTYLKE